MAVSKDAQTRHVSVLKQGRFAQFFALVAMAETAQMLSMSLNMMIEMSNTVYVYVTEAIFDDQMLDIVLHGTLC